MSNKTNLFYMLYILVYLEFQNTESHNYYQIITAISFILIDQYARANKVMFHKKSSSGNSS